MNYSIDEIKEELIKTLRFLEKYNIDYLVVGQSETYKLGFPKVLMLKHLGKNEDDFLDKETELYNKMLISILKPENFIDIYKSKQIKHIDSSGKIPYMFDSNHYSKFGADQIVDKIISQRIEDKLKQKK
ncbi:MAG: hypothetical protein QM564_06965 [Bergeyella sp.]